MNNTTTCFLGRTNAEGVGFERVEAKGVVFTVPFYGAQGHVALGQDIHRGSEFFWEHEFPLGVAFL